MSHFKYYCSQVNVFNKLMLKIRMLAFVKYYHRKHHHMMTSQVAEDCTDVIWFMDHNDSTRNDSEHFL